MTHGWVGGGGRGAARWFTNGNLSGPEGSGSRGVRGSDSGQRAERRWRVCVCVRACEREEERGPGMWEGAARGVAFARGNGGGLLCVVSGGWAALRPTSGRGRAVEGPETGMDGHLVPPGLPSAGLFRSSPASAGREPRPVRPRFRSGKFCDAD